MAAIYCAIPGGTVKHNPAFLKLCEEARNEVAEISIADLQRRKQEGNPYTLIDVREDHEWLQGSIPGAVHMGRGVIERDMEKRFPDKEAELALYCGGGFRSALAAKNLQEMGYKKVFSVAGGIREWKEAGLPLTQHTDKGAS